MCFAPPEDHVYAVEWISISKMDEIILAREFQRFSLEMLQVWSGLSSIRYPGLAPAVRSESTDWERSVRPVRTGPIFMRASGILWDYYVLKIADFGLMDRINHTKQHEKLSQPLSIDDFAWDTGSTIIQQVFKQNVAFLCCFSLC